MEDRFDIQKNEQGIEFHNEYIGKICDGIIEYWKRREINLDRPNDIYGMIYKDRRTLENWESILKKEGIL